MGRTVGWLRLAGGAVILAVLVWRLGTDAFLHGLRTIRGWPLLAAAGITCGTTVCAAVRWRLVARGLGVELRLPAAIGYYYRSQFLNSALPGGVLGDVHRGVQHGRANGDVGRGLRAMIWDRAAGQAVQLVLAVVVLAGFASPLPALRPLHPLLPVLAGCLVTMLAAAVLAARHLEPGTPRAPRTSRTSRLVKLIRTIRADLAALRGPAGAVIALTSAVAVAGHVTVFLIAARTAGTAGSPSLLLSLAMLVLLAMSVPVNVGGWGPREGVAAWAFGAAGLGMNQGVAVATVYGVMTFAATLPGAVVLLVGALRESRLRPSAPRLPVGAHG